MMRRNSLHSFRLNDPQSVRKRSEFQWLLYGALVITMFAIAGCSLIVDPSTPLATATPEPPISFPVQHQASVNWAYPSEGADGILILEGNCLRLGGGSAESRAIIWPFGSVVEQRDGTISVRNDRLGLDILLGDKLLLGGNGFADPGRYSHYLAAPIPDDCYSPYYLTGDIVIE